MHEYPRTISVEAEGFHGFLVIDSAVNGMSAGGVRLKPDLTAEELGLLARVMTLKFGFLGLPCGGAKAGLDIAGPLGPDERAAVFTAFGRALAPLIRTWGFRPGQDLGTMPEDISQMLRGAGVRPFESGALALGSAYTGLSVAIAADQAFRMQARYSDRMSFAIAGFGRVGSAVAREMVHRGSRLVGISTVQGALYDPQGLDLALLQKLQRQHGDGLVSAYGSADRITPGLLLEAGVDVLCPCGGPFAIDDANAARIRARIICPGANLPMTDAAEKILGARGIVCVPDFIANCGGVLGPTMLSSGLPADVVREFMQRRLTRRVAEIMAAAAQNRVPLGEWARSEAAQGFDRVRVEARRYRRWMGLARLGNYFFQKRWIPRRLAAAFARGYFEKKILLAPRPNKCVADDR